MSNLFSEKNDDIEVSPATVGSLALFFTMVIVALVYLSEYSLGTDFSEQKPVITAEMVTASLER